MAPGTREDPWELPLHVTFRVRHEVPALRNKRLVRDFRRSLCDVAPARTWLLTTGWRRYRLIEPSEVPGVA